jgi:Fic family protein
MQHPRFSNRFNFDNEIVAKCYELIAGIDAIKGQFSYTNNLSPQTIKRLSQSVLITSTGASNRIEGNNLSDTEVKELYSKLRIQKFKSRDEQEVAGYIETLALVFENYAGFKLTEGNIQYLQKSILIHSEKDSRQRGNYKFESNQVQARDQDGNIVGIIFDPTPPFLVPKEMQELVEWTNWALETKFRHPLLLIANFIFEFLAIHPFRDGNGRTSRVLSNLLLLQNEYSIMPFISHEKIIEEQKLDYYKALNLSQLTWKKDQEDISPFFIFFLEVVKKQSDLALKLITKEDITVFLSEKQLEVWEFIQVFCQSHQTFKKSDIVNSTKVNSSTVDQILKKLVSMNKISLIGEGRASRYEIVQK